MTPQAANKTIGQGGFQEVEQMALFKDMVGYQEEVRDASRVAEVLNRVIMNAKRLSAPAQINMPRDFWTQVIDIELPAVVGFERPSGGDDAIAAAAKLLASELEGRVTDECVQLHGGAGYMREYEISRIFTDARMSRIYAGSSEIMRYIIGRDVFSEKYKSILD